MKNLLFICSLILLFSCDDGDLQIETIDFDSVNITTCESTITTASTVFFKMNGTEALILTLASGVLKNEASTTTISSAVPGASTLTYRVFTDDVTKNYFCDAIPTASPEVLEQIDASNGEILITTIRVDDGTTISYEHKIELSGITFITSKNERITDLQINDFGTVTTLE